MSHGLLIVGGGLAAQRCCETLRALGHDGPITIAGAEGSEPYDRPPLSKEGLADASADPCFRPREWYASQGVELRLGAAAVRLRPGARTVELAGGERLRYDDLLIATGSRTGRGSLPIVSWWRSGFGPRRCGWRAPAWTRAGSAPARAGAPRCRMSSRPATSPAAGTGRRRPARAPVSRARCSASRPRRPRRRRSGATSSACGCSASARPRAPAPRRLQCVGAPAGARATVAADAEGRGFEAVYRREGRISAVLLAGRSAADLRAARRLLTPEPQLERSAA